MRRKIAFAICGALLLSLMGIAIAFVLSLPPIFERPGQEISYVSFWEIVENGGIAAASYDGERNLLFIATRESGKDLDDLPHDCDYYLRTRLKPLWTDLNGLALRRQEEGKIADYGFDFNVEGAERRFGFFNTLPYLILMLLLAIAIGIMMYAFAKLRRRSLLQDEQRDGKRG